MSRALSRSAASFAFARGENPRTGSALTFHGDVAMSYDEPIAVRVGNMLHATTAKFSMTTSHHRSYVVVSWAVENGSETVIDTDHGEIRAMARERGIRPGPWGKFADPEVREAAERSRREYASAPVGRTENFIVS